MAIMDRVSDVASLEKPVLVAGERGTGKELVANRLHFLSPRWEGQFISINCAAFDPVELDRELFGQTFLDGRDDTNGRFYEANGGTLFLDAVEYIPPYLQEKLIHVIEHGAVQATGELYHEEVDVRVIAATSVDLPRAVRAGHFQSDLLDRLAFHVLTLPPLRARRDDIDPLAQAFGRKIATDLGAPQYPGLSAEAQETLLSHDYPGNVRELKTLIERSVARAFLKDESLSEPIKELVLDPFQSEYALPAFRPLQSGRTAFAAPIEYNAEHRVIGNDAPADPAAPAQQNALPVNASAAASSPPEHIFPEQNFKDRIMVFERRLIDEAMRACGDHQGQAAERLELSYHQFRGLLRKHGLKN